MKRLTIVMVVVLLAAVCCFAEGTEKGKRFEISVQTGIAAGHYDSGAVFGASVSYRLTRRFALEGEFFYYLEPYNFDSHLYDWSGGLNEEPVYMGGRDMDTQAVNMNISGIFSLCTGKKVEPYIAVGFGATSFQYKGISIYGNEYGGEYHYPFSSITTNLNASVGGGVKVYLSKNAGFRLDGRLYYVFFEDLRPYRVTGGYFFRF